jgi:integral membrane protein
MQKEHLIKTLNRFRIVAITEGISFLVLLLIAMPLKYMFDIPEPVTILGWVHGVLFMTFIFFAILVFTYFEKEGMWLVKALLSSLIPFGPFILGRELKMEEQMMRAEISRRNRK